MITEGQQGWVLHKRWSGDTSAQVTFFTREKGVLCALSKGARAPKKQSLLQSFTPLWLSVDTRHDWHYVHQFDPVGASLVLMGDSLFAGLYVNELIYHGMQPLDPCASLYDAYVETLQALTNVITRLDIEKILRRFEWHFLSTCGYELSFTHEALTEKPVEIHSHYNFIPGEGFVLTSKGIPGECIIAMANDELDDPLVLKAAKWIMRRAIDHALGGKRIKARELYTHSPHKLSELERREG